MTGTILIVCLSSLSVHVAATAARRWDLRLPVTFAPVVRKEAPPRLGGTFLLPGIFLGLFFLHRIGLSVPYEQVAPALATIYLIGLYDDLHPLGCHTKLLLQIGAASLPVLEGLRLERLVLAGFPLDLGPWSTPVTVFFLVGVTNAYNLIDGVDGLATGLGVIASGGIAIAAALLGETQVAAMSGVLFASMVALFPVTRSPSRFYLGDSGSHLLGFSLGLLLLLLMRRQTDFGLGLGLLFFSVPAADTTFAIIRRTLSGRYPFHGDEEHIHHRLLKHGLTPVRVDAALWSINLATVVVALALVYATR